ncbi:MAG: preprotein translocase subunit YajC [Myxococcota bacterium]
MDTLETHTLVAADAAPAAGPVARQPGILDTLPMLLAIVAIFYFLLIRPQQKEQREHQQLLASLQKGDKVVTQSGVHGEVYEVQADVVVLTIAEKVRITVDKSAIRRKPGADDKK